MNPLLASSCVGSLAAPTNVDGMYQHLVCDTAQRAVADPAGAARTLSGFGGPNDALRADFASDVARNLSERDLKALARTPAGRDLLDTLEAALAGGGAQGQHQGQVDALQASRLAAAPDASERVRELIRQAAPPGPSNSATLGKNLAAEIRGDMNGGAALVNAILSQPLQEHRFSIANDVAAHLDDQELLTLAKTPGGDQALKQMREALELPYGAPSVQGRRVDAALDPNRYSHAHHVAQVQSDLYAKGLPTSAKGVQVFVVESVTADRPHAEAVKRTVSGTNGLGKGADVVLKGTANHQDVYIKAHPDLKHIDMTDPSIRERAAIGVANLEATLYAIREEIKGVRDIVPADGKTRIVNLSWGREIATVANDLAKRVKADSSAWEVAFATVRRDTGSDPTPAQVREQLAKLIAAEMKQQAAQPANAERSAKLVAELQLEVDAASAKGLVIFNGAGNSGELADKLGDREFARSVTDPVRGIVTVGAADLGSTPSPRDDTMWPDSAPGGRIAAPGVNLPVYERAGQPVGGSGTSFAAPYAASVAALMIAANPRITPAQIRDILMGGRVTNDLPGRADGQGLLDPVKAVEEAKKLARR